MRKILEYPQIDRTKLDTVKTLIDSIAEYANGDYSRELDELNHITGKEHDVRCFFEYWGWTDLDTLAEQALTPEPPCVRDLSKDEIKEMVSIIKKSMESLDDVKTEYYEELLRRSLPLYDVQEYIGLEEDEETIVKRMLQASSESIIYL